LQAGHGLELVNALENGATADLAIIDLDMPVMNGFETLDWLREHRPDIRALVLSFDASEGALIRSLRAGARGHLPKDAEPEEFKLALDHISTSGYYQNESLLLKMANHGDMRTRAEQQAAEVRSRLTTREREIITLSCAPQEYTYKEIAAHLDLLPSTVESHRKRIFQKFNIKSKAGLVQFAFKWGIVKG
jgi:two-component system, NarL family, invasion response regulator UvrY